MVPRGFTTIEVLIALILFGAGALSLAAGSGLAIRMITRGRHLTAGSVLASRRLEILRGQVGGGCIGLASGATGPVGGLSEQWWVTGSGRSRMVTVVVRYPGQWAGSSDTLLSILRCE
jgi:prepilin-type N-terminal cleavage/methylation domain-containing protein